MPFSARFFALAATSVLAAPVAYADVVISTGTTANMSCSAGVCAPTAADAVLNVSDLENMLASENLSVTTTNGGVQANNIDIASAVSWSSANSLTLDAHQSVTFAAAVSVKGSGGVTLLTNDGGSGGVLTFAIGSGQLAFASAANTLSINARRYKLENSLKLLANAIAADPEGDFALSRDANAAKDGVYSCPISLPFGGAFNGLGHAITNLEIVDPTENGVGQLGLFAEVRHSGSVASLSLRGAVVTGNDGWSATLAGVNNGIISNSFVSGSVRVKRGEAGGLAGENLGTITTSQSVASVKATDLSGGLVADNPGIISQSFATGAVSGSEAGGLFGESDENATIENSYALGKVVGGHAGGGGFAGNTAASISTSYSIGAVSGRHSTNTVGGFDAENGGSFSNCYWDTQTSGQEQGSGEGSDSGLTGLTTAQFQSGLPAGFDPTIWAQSSGINNGFPYLIANPPAGNN